MDFILLLISIIYFENINIKIQYAANNPGVIKRLLTMNLGGEIVGVHFSASVLP